MTTEHLDIPEEELDKILGGAGKAARSDNDDALIKDVAGIDAQIGNILYGASVLTQRKLDRKAKVEEEIRDRQHQREQIRNRFQHMLSTVTDEPALAPAPVAPVALVSDPVNPPSAPQPSVSSSGPVVDEPDEDELLEGLYTRDELMELSDSDLQRLASEYGIATVVTDATRVIVIATIIVQQSAYCQCEGIEDPNGTSTTRVTVIDRVRDSRHNPRSWNIWQWVGAIIGALIGIVIYRVTNDWEQDIEGTWNRVFDMLLFIALVGLGFFGGAIIGAAVEDRQENLRSRS
ncbi:DUF2273 domain-containing protein [Candidatus Saccharibacteria bacterium]|nr:DUF2273 domain-containing protein [Candidatus Saccharibacteria bacterium]